MVTRARTRHEKKFRVAQFHNSKVKKSISSGKHYVVPVNLIKSKKHCSNFGSVVNDGCDDFFFESWSPRSDWVVPPMDPFDEVNTLDSSVSEADKKHPKIFTQANKKR